MRPKRLKKSPSRACAKGIRAPVRMPPLMAPMIESSTTADGASAPAGPLAFVAQDILANRPGLSHIVAHVVVCGADHETGIAFLNQLGNAAGTLPRCGVPGLECSINGPVEDC